MLLNNNVYVIAVLTGLMIACGDPAPLEKKDPTLDASMMAVDAGATTPDATPTGGIPTAGTPMGGMVTGGSAGNDGPSGGLPSSAGEAAMAGEPTQMGGIAVGGSMSGGSPAMMVEGPPCQVLHSEDNPLDARPNTAHSTLVYDGGPVHFVWADTNGVHTCTIGPDGQFQGPRTQVDTPDYSVEFVASLRVDGVPWVAFGATDQPIRIFQAHRPQQTLVSLAAPEQTLVGKPILANATGKLMVVGQTPTGALGWHISFPMIWGHRAYLSKRIPSGTDFRQAPVQ